MISFISGHLDLTEEEFKKHYAPVIDMACENPVAEFVVGDARGCDTMAQQYLNRYHPVHKVTVYHMLENPRNNPCEYLTVGGFTSDEERDAAMTYVSDEDIAWVRPGRERSGTKFNLHRRYIKYCKQAISKTLGDPTGKTKAFDPKSLICLGVHFFNGNPREEE